MKHCNCKQLLTVEPHYYGQPWQK